MSSYLNVVIISKDTDVFIILLTLHIDTGSLQHHQHFAGQDKVKPLNLIRKKQEFREVFMALGQDWHDTDEMLHTIQSFTCSM